MVPNPERSYSAHEATIIVEDLPNGDFLIRITDRAVSMRVTVPVEVVKALFCKANSQGQAA